MRHLSTNNTNNDPIYIDRDYLNSLSESVKDDLIISNKSVFIFHHFLLDHPDTLITTWSQLSYILQEKSSMKDWYDDILSKWKLLNDVPSWLLGNAKLREHWLTHYHNKLVSLRLAQSKCLEADNKAKEIYDQSLKTNAAELHLVEEQIYDENPIILIHKIMPSALSEADLLKLHDLNKEERKLKRKELLDDYKLNLMERFINKQLTLKELNELVK
jgi:hypothetical protein